MKINGLFLLIGLFLGACQDKEVNEGVPVIFLKPDDAGTFKISEYFDGYRVLTFNNILCNRIADFVELPDKFLALAEVRHGLPKTTLHSFNLQGNWLDSIGSFGRGPGEYSSAGNQIVLNRDSTIMIFDQTKYLNYTSENNLLYERLYIRGNNKIGSLGQPVYLWDDTTILFLKNLNFSEPTSSMNKMMKKSLEGSDLLNVYSIPGEKKMNSFFPCEDVFGYYLQNKLYVFQDTVCFYHEKNGYVYDVFYDRVVPRYKIDKGNYSVETTIEQFEDLHGDTRGISVRRLNETDKYIMGIYWFGNRNYYFCFDKKSHVTKNFKLLDDDLLKTGITKSKFSPSKFFGSWHNKIQFPTDYLYFFYSPREYAELIKYIQSQLSEKEWEKYKEEHPDLMKVYDGLTEDSNTIILGLKFK